MTTLDDALPNDDVAEATSRGDYKRALKLLDKAIWPLSQADDIAGTERVAREARRIAEETTGRTHKRALEVEAKATRSIEAIRRFVANREREIAALENHVVTVRVEHADVTPVGVVIAAVGAVVMLIAIFLPRVESNSFLRVAKNTLIQSGGGWWFIGIAVAIVGTTWRAYNQQLRSWAPAVLGGIAIAVAIYYGTSKNSLTLCPVQSGLGLSCSKASPGVGIYAAGVGGVLALVGGWQIGSAEVVEPEADVDGEDDDQDESHQDGGSDDIATRLRRLKDLHVGSLITEDEYVARRKALLDEI